MSDSQKPASSTHEADPPADDQACKQTDPPVDDQQADRLSADDLLSSKEVSEVAAKALDLVFGFGKEKLESVEKELSKPKSNPGDQNNKPEKLSDLVLDSSLEKESRFKELGLGRGVDGTHRTPWLTKSSFQVRQISKDNLIGTDEGGSLHKYELEVSSVSSQQAKLDASITIPDSPVTLGIDAELSRSVTKKQKAIGRRVINRTISFISQFDDLPKPNSSGNDKAKDDEQTSFEEHLAKYILDGIKHEQADTAGDGETTTPNNQDQSILHQIASYLAPGREVDEQCIIECCEAFVRQFHITHYVRSITLGASEYFVESEEEYYRKLGSTGKFGYEGAAGVNASQEFIKKSKNKSSDLQHIGRIGDNGKVERGTSDEAVIGVELEPIHHLVQTPRLRDFLQNALQRYIADRNRKTGPYVISCSDAKIFWTVIEKDSIASIYGTTTKTDASLFYIFPTEDGRHQYEFYIGWQGENLKEELEKKRESMKKHSTDLAENVDIKRTMRYLNAPVNISGRNDGPLRLESRVKKHWSRFSLHSRLTKHFDENVDPEEWFYGEESFLIECTRRIFRVDGYVGIQKVSDKAKKPQEAHQKSDSIQLEEIREKELSPPSPDYKTTCIPSSMSHNARNIWMVFRLLPEKYWNALIPEEDSSKPGASTDIPPSEKTSQSNKRQVPVQHERKDSTTV